MCDWGPNKDKDEYGGYLCSDWLTTCDKDGWLIHPKLATQPFMEILPSAFFKLLVNDLDSHKGIGVTAPSNNAVAVSGKPFTFKWDAKGYVHYAGNSEISAEVPVENVDIKLFYFSNCIPETFMLCEENVITLTTGSGTPNDGEETLIMEECSSKGHKLSDASGALAGNSIYAIIQGKENTNVVSRMDGSFSIKEADTCEKVDITFTFGESYLNIEGGDEVKLSVQVIKTWYKDDVERFTSEQAVAGNYTWNEALPLKDQCGEQCMIISIIQTGLTGDSCVIWGGSIKQYMQAYKEGEWSTILVDIENCPFIDSFGETEMPAYVTVRWDKSIKCPAGMYLDDNWFLMEKFVEKDSCKVCEPNKYSIAGGESCLDCPAGKIAGSEVPSGHDSANDCRACTFGKYYKRDMTFDVSLDGVSVFTPFYCEVCGNDKYNDVLGSAECKTCPEGKSARGDKAEDHRSIDTCVDLCVSGDTYFVAGGVYCKSKKWGACYSFGYEDDAWCQDCELCSDCKDCKSCSKCGGGHRSRELSGAGDYERGEQLMLEPEEKEVDKGVGSSVYSRPLTRRRQGGSILAAARESRDGKKKETLVSFYKRPVTLAASSAAAAAAAAAEFDSSSQDSSSDPRDSRALTSSPITDPCDTLFYGFGLKGGITKFTIVNPGGGLHPGLFHFDLYNNPDGQIDWKVFGPIKTNKHYYRHCKDITQPTLDPFLPCPVGTYSKDNTHKPPCLVCPAGTYADATGANACTSCPAGTYLLDDKQMRAGNHDSVKDCASKLCPAGRYILPTSGTATLTIRASSFSINECGPCLVGTYSEGGNSASACVSCAKGKYSNSVGSYECIDCAKGTYASSTSSGKCILCQAGKYGTTMAAEADSACDACDAGTYSKESGATSEATCVPCKSGTASGTPGAGSESSCTACSGGTYALKTGSAVCDQCVKGTFTNSTGSEHCRGCGYGRYGDVVGATSEVTGCKDCPGGTYNGFKSTSVCETCTAPLVVSKDRSDCVEDEPEPVDPGTTAPTPEPPAQTSAPTPTPAPEIDSSKPEEFECASSCSPNLFAACDTSLFISPCSKECDAQHLNILKAYFNEGCPDNFQGPSVTYIEIESGYDIGGCCQKSTIKDSDKEYLRTVIKVGQASLMPGITPDEIEILSEATWTQQGSRSMLADVVALPVRFKLRAPLDNVAFAQGVETPDSSTAAGQQAMKKIAQNLWSSFEGKITTGNKDVVDEGLKEVGELPPSSPLGIQLKTASVSKTSMAAPEITIIVVEAEDKGGGGEDEKKKPVVKEAILTKDKIFFGVIALVVAGCIVGGFVYLKKSQAKAEEEKKTKAARKEKRASAIAGGVGNAGAAAKRSSTAGGGASTFKRMSSADRRAPPAEEDSAEAADGVELSETNARAASFRMMAANPMRSGSEPLAPVPPSSPPPLPPPPPPPALPKGWSAVFDAGQQKHYFVNDATRATQWDFPR